MLGRWFSSDEIPTTGFFVFSGTLVNRGYSFNSWVSASSDPVILTHPTNISNNWSCNLKYLTNFVFPNPEIRFLYGTIWVIFWGDLKTVFLLVFDIQFLDFTFLHTWDVPTRVREYPRIKLFKVKSLVLLRFTVLGSELAPSQPKPHFWGVPQRKPQCWNNKLK